MGFSFIPWFQKLQSEMGMFFFKHENEVLLVNDRRNKENNVKLDRVKKTLRQIKKNNVKEGPMKIVEGFLGMLAVCLLQLYKL